MNRTCKQFVNFKKNKFNNLSFESRLKYYLGMELYKINKINIKNGLKFKDLDKPILNSNGWGPPMEIYNIPLKNLLIQTNHIDKLFCFTPGDIEESQPITTLVKNRINSKQISVILRSLEFDRHWNAFYNINDNVFFRDKKDIVFWRGATTGHPFKIANRFLFVKQWFNKLPEIDVGFNLICQNQDKYNKYLKDTITINEFYKYKYLISIEGNDKDSGLNWKLASNSLVMMAKPRCCSWLMEDMLIPNYHYLLLKDDFSDLLEKLEWCKTNSKEVLDIIHHASEYMNTFKNNKLEQTLEQTVINNYFKRIC